MFFRWKPSLFYRTGLLTCLLAVAACDPAAQGNGAWIGGGTDSPARHVDSEDILDAEGGSYQIVEEEAVAPSPEEMHRLARKGVNPADMKKHSHGVDFSPKEGEEEYRVLRLVRNGAEPETSSLQMLPAKSDLILKDDSHLTPLPGRKPEQPQYAQAKPEKERGDIRVVTAYDKKEEKVAKPQAKPEPAPEPVSEKAKPRSSGDAPEVADVRFGKHPGKTRMVLDLTGPAKFVHNIDNDEHILAIQVEHAVWQGGLDSKALQNDMISSYKAYQDEDGVILALKLKKPARVIWAAALKPDQGKGDRLVFDIGTL